MTRELLENALREHGLIEASRLTPKNQAYEVTASKNRIEITVTIPFSVYEIFFRATDLSDGHRIEDWDESYGETRHSDFLATLREVLWALKNAEFRLSDAGTPPKLPRDRKTVDYKDQRGEWRHLFGKNW